MPKGIFIRSEKNINALRERMTGHIPWNKGKHPLSEEVKKRISEGVKRLWKEGSFKGYKHSEETKRKIGLAMRKFTGEKTSNWKGGITSETHKRIGLSSWKILRKVIYKRDDYTCQICNVKYCDKNHNPLCVHHITPYRITQDDSPENLITLCKSCHNKEEVKYYKQLKENGELF